ncbi:MAG TPA: hypothetical protein VK687_09935, partial [Bryobacteraceae bacterium]|nr:hypothetical protein [Bryobacteraceae bacterium]
MRSMVDRQYCSPQHRKEARLASAVVFREEEDDDQELWSVSRSKQKHHGRPDSASHQTASIFAFLTLAALLIAMLMPGNGTEPSPTYTPLSLDAGAKRGLLSRSGDAIGEVIRNAAPVTLHHDFQGGLKDWSTMALRTAAKVDDPHDWKTPSVVAPGSLRLWTRSTLLKNYQMEFQGEIERKSLSWAFRASDSENYYAAKIQITRPGPLPNADLVRYVMLKGRELDRVQLPLPLTLERGGDYRVRVTIQDDRFVTYLNGQVISAWTDKR